MISQVTGLAQQLSKKIIEIKTDLIFPWSKLQPGFIPIYKWIFKNKFKFDLMPNIIISCGRKSVYTSLYLKKIYGKKIINIHIQNPKVNFNNFDYVVIPNHDNCSGINVLKTSGAIHKFSNNILKEYKDFNNFNKINNLVSIFVGGTNQHYNFSYDVICNFIDKIKYLKNKFINYEFYIIPSRRTDEATIKLFNQRLGKKFKIWDKKTENPYFFALQNSKFFIVTSDSTSMISECAITGKPIHIYHLPFKRNSERIIRFHREFEEKNITIKLDDKLETWNYEPLDEAKRIAGILRSRILE